MHWSVEYIGLPWQVGGLTRDGIACWGLARLVYAECLGITVPDYAAAVASIEERAEVAAIFAEGTASTGPWVEIAMGGLPLDVVQEFDILVFQRAGLAHHVGIAIGGGRMLHIDADQDSCLVDYTAGRWAPRLVGAYRHKEWIMAGPFGLPRGVLPLLAATTCLPIAALAACDGSGERLIEVVMRQGALA